MIDPQTGKARFACRPERSRGRLVAESEPPERSVFQRDRDRILHSAAFRRLQYKTQVFVYHEGDHYRTRLTHSLEVAQIARSVARALALDEDLAEALALAHDLGHPPFGHAGEDALNKAMIGNDGFDHNDQAMRVLTLLERRYIGFDGLNLTWETLEGLVKHNGPLNDPPPTIRAYSASCRDLELSGFASAEAQVAALADDVAYNAHDVDDGLRAGLFTPNDLLPVPLVGPILASILVQNPDLEASRLIHETVRRMISTMVTDLLTETRRRIDQHRPASVEDVRALGQALVSFSPAMQDADKALKRFLFRHMYRHYKVNRATSKARRVVAELFAVCRAEPQILPPEWQAKIERAGTDQTARIVADYIAGMTDRYAFDEHRRLLDPYSK